MKKSAKKLFLFYFHIWLVRRRKKQFLVKWCVLGEGLLKWFNEESVARPKAISQSTFIILQGSSGCIPEITPKLSIPGAARQYFLARLFNISWCFAKNLGNSWKVLRGRNISRIILFDKPISCLNGQRPLKGSIFFYLFFDRVLSYKIN